jgi:RimJ/RimL family protein N-acetyltransferase
VEETLLLREVVAADLRVFFEHGKDPVAVHMAAFTAKNPSDRTSFEAHWEKIRARPQITIRTVVVGEAVAGHVASFEMDGRPEVTYWIGREFWGRGIATTALRQFLAIEPRRPIYARVAKDNLGSRRVLEKCGFAVCGKARGFANGRGREIDELVLKLA